MTRSVSNKQMFSRFDNNSNGRGPGLAARITSRDTSTRSCVTDIAGRVCLNTLCFVFPEREPMPRVFFASRGTARLLVGGGGPPDTDVCCDAAPAACHETDFDGTAAERKLEAGGTAAYQVPRNMGNVQEAQGFILDSRGGRPV